MKFKKIIIVVYILSIIICFFATKLYYTGKLKKEAIKRCTTNVEFCDFLLGALNDKKQIRRGLNVLKDVQIKLLAKDMGVPNNAYLILEKTGNLQPIKPRKLKLGDKFP